MVEEIYFPMTCNVLTKGHIRCIEILQKKGNLTIGLLTAKALEGYKKEIVPYTDRKYILDTIARVWGNVVVVPQDSLNPKKNVVKYKSTSIASGDGWEKSELKVIEDTGIRTINLNSKCSLHSSDIYETIGNKK